jgi:hypothetical protein
MAPEYLAGENPVREMSGVQQAEQMLLPRQRCAQMFGNMLRVAFAGRVNNRDRFHLRLREA